MPYEYRKLTPEEREFVLNQRRALGYPLHAPPHPFRDAGRYLISAANFEHVPIMASPDRRTEFETRLLAIMEEIHGEVYGWNVLPNHYHILLGVDSLDLVSAALKQLHGATSRVEFGRWADRAAPCLVQVCRSDDPQRRTLLLRTQLRALQSRQARVHQRSVRMAVVEPDQLPGRRARPGVVARDLENVSARR